MQFVDGSHRSGFFEQIQYNTNDGNVLSDHSDLVIPHELKKNIVQTELLPGQCSFHDGMYLIYMPPALPAAKVLDCFADCRRQSQTGKTGKERGKFQQNKR